MSLEPAQLVHDLINKTMVLEARLKKIQRCETLDLSRQELEKALTVSSEIMSLLKEYKDNNRKESA